MAYLIASPFVAIFKTRYGCRLAEREAALIGPQHCMLPGGHSKGHGAHRSDPETVAEASEGGESVQILVWRPGGSLTPGVQGPVGSASTRHVVPGCSLGTWPVAARTAAKSDLALAGGLNMILEPRDLVGSSPVMNAENRRTLQCRLP